MAIEIYAGYRHCGKTQWLIEKSAITGIPIAVATMKKGRELVEKAKEMGYIIPNPISLVYHGPDQPMEDILIDDMDEILPGIFPDIKIHAATVTASNMKEKSKMEKENMDGIVYREETEKMKAISNPKNETKILKDTITDMLSDNYKDRFISEYWQTKIRYERLKKLTTKAEAAELTNAGEISGVSKIDGTPVRLLRDQQHFMGEYLHILEVRAVIENIDI